MSPWRGWILTGLTVAVGIAGVVLYLDVNAAVSGEDDGDDLLVAQEGVKSEFITPPGSRPPTQPPRPPPRPRASSNPASAPPSPTFRLGGIPPIAGETGLPPTDDSELQQQLANRRLAALERRVRAMKRRIESMTNRGSAQERIDAQQKRMEALIEEIQEKRREMGMPEFDPSELE